MVHSKTDMKQKNCLCAAIGGKVGDARAAARP
jgi:hypothetical protein